MDTREHPEFDLYHRDQELVAACRRAISAWVAAGTPVQAPDGVLWTPANARAFVEEMGHLFRQYNLVLWRTFSYCRRCQGGCCVVGASQVTMFDALALALLDEPFPHMAPRAAAGDCIYLGAQGCRWPQSWRPIKCWAFYCLGSGDWTLDAGDERYRQITQALQDVVRRRLPGTLRQAELAGRPPHHQFLSDPIAFAEALGETLYDLFVAPFCAVYDDLGTAADTMHAAGVAVPPNDRSSIDAALVFITDTVEAIWQNGFAGGDVGAERFLTDLECLEWVLLERPPGMQEVLQALLQRYRIGDEDCAPDSSVPATLRQQMATMLHRLLHDDATTGRGP